MASEKPESVTLPAFLGVAKSATRRPHTSNGTSSAVVAESMATPRLPSHGGAGGGIRTHKGLRPEMCGVSAFTGFATPAPRRLRTPAIQKTKTQHLTHAAAREATIRARQHRPGTKNVRAGPQGCVT